MPVRRAESLTTLRVQCRAPNSLADSRHQAWLVSDRRTHPGAAKPVDELLTNRPARIGIFGRGIGSDEDFVSQLP